MMAQSLADLAASPHAGTSDRRAFVVRAAAGLSLGLLGPAMRATGASAQDATPAGGHTMASASEHYALADVDAEAIWFIGTLALIKGVGSQTGGALATVEFLHPLGFATPLHVHHTADESFYVLEGSIRGVCGDQQWQATTGGFVWLPRGIPHGYAVDGDATLRTLAITVPAGFDRFVVEAGEPARERALPPPAPPDIEKLEAAGAKYGIETVGPPVQFAGTPTA
jgi:mannose-6-phosphate isomerase-like protein (cupin superfamily)